MKTAAKVVKTASLKISPIILGLCGLARLPTGNLVALGVFLIVLAIVLAVIFKLMRKDIESLLKTIFTGKAEVELAKKGKQKSPPTSDRPETDDSESDS